MNQSSFLTNNPHILEIGNYVPGKSKIKHDNPIKLSSNENALRASPFAIEAYQKYASNIFRYPDGSCTKLREAIGLKHKISEDRIVCGAGSDEIISLLMQSFCKIGDEIIYSEYGFLMYPISAKRVGATPIKVKEKNLKTDVDAIIKTINQKTRAIFIANPNNPTGSYLTKDEIDFLIKNTPKHILIVLDCAYEEFVEEKDYPNAIEIVNQNSNVVLTRTFSKIYGLASLRIGWCYSSLEVANILNKVRGPFNVSEPAQACAIAALQDDDFLLKSKNHNKKWLEIFYSKTKNIKNITCYNSVANFILIDFGSEENCKKANEKLLNLGIIFREMNAYNLLNCLRATIGTEEENLQILNFLQNEFS